MNAWQVVAALAVPFAGILTAFLSKEKLPGMMRRMRASAEIMKELHEGSQAYQQIDLLIASQAKTLMSREELAAGRKLNVSNVVLVVILFIVTALIMFFFVQWCVATWESPYAWVSLTISFLVGIFLLLLIASGFTTIYKPAREKN